jgi:hypothetical protein
MTMDLFAGVPVREHTVAAAWYETYANGFRKATFRDSDGNKIGLGSAPA